MRQPSVASPQDLLPSLALDARRLWKVGRSLEVGFLDGTDWQHDVVRTWAIGWSEFANIHFDFDPSPPQIRVSFDQTTGSWSRVGTDALVDEPSSPTMNLGWIESNRTEEELRSLVLHEFGHALGCIHEHQNPVAGIPWDLEAVFRYYSGPPNFWSQEQTRFNLIEAYDRDYTKFSAFDPLSIMIYPIPKEHTVGDFHVDPTFDLSDGDKAYIGRTYPQDQTILTLPLGEPLEIPQRLAVQEDQLRLKVDIGDRYVIHTSGPTNVRLAVFGPDNRSRQVAADGDSGIDGYNARVETVLMPGIYWIRVQHEQETPGNYTVQAERVTNE